MTGACTLKQDVVYFRHTFDCAHPVVVLCKQPFSNVAMADRTNTEVIVNQIYTCAYLIGVWLLIQIWERSLLWTKCVTSNTDKEHHLQRFADRTTIIFTVASLFKTKPS